MQSLFNEVISEIPLSSNYETDCRDIWPKRWALLKAKVEKFTSTNSESEAITLWREYFAALDKDNVTVFLFRNADRLNAVLA